VEHRPAGQERDGVLRLLSLELIFADASCAAALSDEKLLGAMGRFEAALARASAASGFIAPAYAEVISDVCKRASFDSVALARAARDAGTLAIPFVKALTEQVASASPQAARYVHFGATSQDVIDSAVALCLKEASARVAELTITLGDALAELAQRHGATPMLARTLLQPAAPVSFGWKAAMWLAPLARALPRFQVAAADACALQFGGASGVLSAFADRGSGVAGALAGELGLQCRVTWHSARDAFARFGAEAAILVGLSAKIGRDVALLAQAEVGELAEPAAGGRGGSSSMPHKRNPALSLLALEAARRAPSLAATLLNQLDGEHERGLGQWQSQWFTLRELTSAAASALGAVGEVLRGLEVHAAAMRANIDRTNGLAFSEALALRLSRPVADRLVSQAAREHRHLLDVLRADMDATRELGAVDAARLFEPQASYGVAAEMTERVLSDWTTARGSAP
jgi:3-carboxy-cis,cis-muconate cycloisomerase